MAAVLPATDPLSGRGALGDSQAARRNSAGNTADRHEGLRPNSCLIVARAPLTLRWPERAYACNTFCALPPFSSLAPTPAYSRPSRARFRVKGASSRRSTFCWRACQRLMALLRILPEERPVVQYLRPIRDEAKIAVVWRQPRQKRIDLQHVHAPLRCEAQIDARDVSAPQRHERCAARSLDGPKLVLRQIGGAILVAHVPMPVLLARVVVDRPVSLRFWKDHLHWRQHPRTKLAEQPHRELAPLDVLLDQRRLPVPLDELARHFAQSPFVVAHALRARCPCWSPLDWVSR